MKKGQWTMDSGQWTKDKGQRLKDKGHRVPYRIFVPTFGACLICGNLLNLEHLRQTIQTIFRSEQRQPSPVIPRL